MSDVVIKSGPCACCGNCFSGRTKGGFANTSCGFASFDDRPPGSLTHYYRTKTLAGSICSRFGFDPTCVTILGGGGEKSYSGSCAYSVTCVDGILNCNFANTGGQQVEKLGTLDCSTFDRTEITPACQIGPFSDQGGSVVYSSTSTQFKAQGTGTCIYINPIIGAVMAIGTATETLSDEITDDSAKAELLACAQWTAYGTDPASLTAAWSVNIYGSGFAYQDAQWKIQITGGLKVGATYHATVNYYRRVYGIAPFVLWRTDTVSGVADGSGALLITGDVPNAEGYETLAACDCNLTKV